MKRILQYLNISLLLTVIGSSCIKEKYKIDVADNTSRPITEFTTAKEGVNSLALTYGTQFIEVDLTEVRIPPRSVVKGDVQVKVALNNTLVANAGYTTPPPGSYSIISYDLNLPAATKKAMVRIKINPSMITGGSYAIGLTIQQVSEGEISTLYKDILIEIKVKNDYEGLYHSTGERILYAGPTVASGIANTVQIDDDKYLYTVDQTTVETDVADLIGGAWMFLQVNPATNNVTVAPSTLSPTFLLSNNGPCIYDPVTKTFSLHYKYFNASGNLRVITETIVAK